MLNNPKTGSTFARSVIKQVVEKRRVWDHSEFCIDLQLPNIKIKGQSRPADQHGTYSQIPFEYSHLPVVSIIRNPYDRVISTYEFRHWAEWTAVPKEIISKIFKKFPDLSFEEYVRFTDYEMIYGRFNGISPKANIGNQTAQFIQMFFKNPNVILDSIDENYIKSKSAATDMGSIIFLRQEFLRNDLKLFLLGVGFSEDECDPIINEPDINVTPRKSSNRSSYWTSEIVDYITYKERLLFDVLASKGVFYEKPLANA